MIANSLSFSLLFKSLFLSNSILTPARSANIFKEPIKSNPSNCCTKLKISPFAPQPKQ